MCFVCVVLLFVVLCLCECGKSDCRTISEEILNFGVFSSHSRAQAHINMHCPLNTRYCGCSYSSLRPHRNKQGRPWLESWLFLFLVSLKALTVAPDYNKGNQYSCLISTADWQTGWGCQVSCPYFGGFSPKFRLLDKRSQSIFRSDVCAACNDFVCPLQVQLSVSNRFSSAGTLKPKWSVLLLSL